MQTKFNRYMAELNAVVDKLKSFPDINCISSTKLKYYHSLVSQKEKLQKKINQMLNKRANIIGVYNDKNQTWIASNMNCRKYCRLESIASYKRDLALYHAGFLDKYPLPKFIQTITNFFSPKKINSFTSKIPLVNKTKKFIQTDLPISMTKAAISSTKKCIVSYRKFSNLIHSYSRSISSSTPIKTLSFIINQAKQEADLVQNPFLSRIKVNPQTFEYFNQTINETGYYGTGKPIVPHVSTASTSFIRQSKSIGAR